VYDTYRLFVGTTDAREPGAGYGGPPLPERYKCKKGCSGLMRVIGSLFEPQDRTMWLHEPHTPIQMTRSQINEWRQLIRDAGFPIPRQFFRSTLRMLSTWLTGEVKNR